MQKHKTNAPIIVIFAAITGFGLYQTCRPPEPEPLLPSADAASPDTINPSPLPLPPQLPSDAGPADSTDSSVDAGPGHSIVILENLTDNPTTVHVSFGADSAITTFPFCQAEPSGCFFPLAKHSEQNLPTNGNYLNATFTFDAPLGCGTTKAEVNANNPNWYSIIDVSLVDGYSNRIKAIVSPFIPASPLATPSTALSNFDAAVLGPPNGKDNNEKVYGLYPYGCDLCAARGNPPCGIAGGNKGCKAGTQYDPHPPCQHQGSVMGGGEVIRVQLVK